MQAQHIHQSSENTVKKVMLQDKEKVKQHLMLDREIPEIEQESPIALPKEELITTCKKTVTEYNEPRIIQHNNIISTIEFGCILVTTLTPVPGKIWTLIDKNCTAVGGPLSEEDMNEITLDQDGVCHHIRNAAHKGIVHDQKSTYEEDTTIYASLSNGTNNIFNIQIYSLYLRNMLNTNGMQDSELRSNCSLLKKLIPKTNEPIYNTAYRDQYTDMMISMHIIHGQYNRDEANSMSEQLIELPFKHDSLLSSNAYPYIVGEPKVKDMRNENYLPNCPIKPESMDINNLLEVTIVTIPIFFDIPRMKRELLLQRGYTILQSLTITEQMTENNLIKTMCPIYITITEEPLDYTKTKYRCAITPTNNIQLVLETRPSKPIEIPNSNKNNQYTNYSDN